MVRRFALHHIAKPISLHSYPPVARLIQSVALIFSIIFLLTMASLLYLAYQTLEGAPLFLLLAITLPLTIGVVLFSFLLYYKRTFRRELRSLKRKYALRLR